MSDLLSGTSGNGRVSNGGSRAATAGSVPVTSEPRSGSGIRTPRDVWNDRQAREARRRAEADAARVADEEKQAQLRAAQEDERRRRSAEERASAAGVGAQTRIPASQRSGGATAGSRLPGESAASASATTGASAAVPTGSQANPSSQAYTRQQRSSSQSQQVPRPAPAQQPATASGAAPRTQQSQSQARQPAGTAGPSQTRPAPPPGAAQSSSQAAGAEPGQSRQSAFPHAFERWETLSSHWEGLTSYWIRRLEQYMEENRPEPLIQQMSRQITDLSAAGANLFHAVVELQRLRASSERKFQRWFFETRQEQERAQEIQMGLNRQIDAERQAREEAEQRAEQRIARAEREKKNTERLLTEMRRELQISKDEARRAWEELGRREQEERERTLSLREGQPTLVGGVQVVPMQAMVSRHGSSAQRPGTRERLGEEEEHLEQAYSYEGASPTDTDPFTEHRTGGLRHEPDVPSLPRGAYSGTPATSSTTRTTVPASEASAMPAPLRTHQTPTTSAPGTAPSSITSDPPPEHFYTHAGAYIHGQQSQPSSSQHPATQAPLIDPATAPTPHSEASFVPSIEASTEAPDEEEYVLDGHGQYVLDDHGRPIPYRRRHHHRHQQQSQQAPHPDDQDDDYDVRAELERERELARAYGVGGTSSSGAPTAQHPATSGGPPPGGYAPAPMPPPVPDYSGGGYGDWTGMPRHYHPSRLSDVLEEDERSRTSPSRTSQVSRTY